MAFVTSVFPNPAQPVLGTFAEERARALSQLARVRVVAPVAWCPPLPLPARFRRFRSVPGDRRLADCAVPVSHPRRFVVPKHTGTLNGRAYARTLAGRLRRLHRTEPLDVIDAHFVWPDGYAAVLAGARLGVPVCVTAHGSDLTLLPGYPAIRRQIVETLQRADRVVGVSRALIDLALELGAPERRCRVVPPGVDLQRFRARPAAGLRRRLRLPADRPILVGVGALIERKGFEFVVEALPLLHDTGIRPLLVLVGEGPRRTAIEAAAACLGIADDVRLVGARPHDEVGDWMGAADAVVLPSSREGWPTILYEAWACGTPVAATAVQGSAEAITRPELGELLEDRRPETLAAGIAALLRRPRRTGLLVQHARRRPWRQVAEESLAILRACQRQRGAQTAAE